MAKPKNVTTVVQDKSEVEVKEKLTPTPTPTTEETTGKTDETAASKQADESPVVDPEDQDDQNPEITDPENQPNDEGNELSDEEAAALKRLQEENAELAASRQLSDDDIFKAGVQSQIDAYVNTFISGASRDKRIARQAAFMAMVERLVYVDDANHLFIGMDTLLAALREHREGLMSDAQLYAHANMVPMAKVSIDRYHFIMTVLDTIVRVLAGKSPANGALDLTKFSETIVNRNGIQYAERFQRYYQLKVNIKG